MPVQKREAKVIKPIPILTQRGSLPGSVAQINISIGIIANPSLEVSAIDYFI